MNKTLAGLAAAFTVIAAASAAAAQDINFADACIENRMDEFAAVINEIPQLDAPPGITVELTNGTLTWEDGELEKLIAECEAIGGMKSELFNGLTEYTVVNGAATLVFK